MLCVCGHRRDQHSGRLNHAPCEAPTATLDGHAVAYCRCAIFEEVAPIVARPGPIETHTFTAALGPVGPFRHVFLMTPEGVVDLSDCKGCGHENASAAARATTIDHA